MQDSSIAHGLTPDNYSTLLITLPQIEYAEKKKAEGKKMRDDKGSVMDMLFAAFEKHQYYNIKDLVKITRQPIVRIFPSKIFLVFFF